MDWSKLRYFKESEMACPCCGAAHMDEEFMHKLDALRDVCRFQFVLSSGYRCERHNAEVGGAEDSPHLYGKAADIVVYGARAHELLKQALAAGFAGIGVKQHGKFGSRFIHLDTMPDGKHPRPTVWTYKGE